MKFGQNNLQRLFATAWAILVLSSVQAQFTIMPDSYITIKEGSTLKIGTDLNIKSIAGGSGYLVDQTVDGDVNITGNITVERYMSAGYWHNASSPVSNANSSVYPGTDLVFYYDETLIINDWMFGWVMYSGALSVMRGYDVFFDTNPVTVIYTATGAQTINTGVYNTGVTITWFQNGEIDARRGWNLLANPYPSPVDWQATGWVKTDINNAKYIWDGPNDNYTIWLGGSPPIGINGGTQYIPSNQGFWVQAVQNGTVQVSNSTRIGEIPLTPDFYKSTEVDYPLLDLVAKANGYSDECVVRFLEGTTESFDLNYDACKLFSQGEKVPQICTWAGKAELAVNTLPQQKDGLMLNMEFSCKTSGYYSIELGDKTNLDPFTEVYLKDVREQKIVNLTSELSYIFYHETLNAKNRFKIFFNPSEDIINNITPDDYFSVFANQGSITIRKNTVSELSGVIRIYNSMGQNVYETNFHNENEISLTLNLTPAYYYVSIHTGKQVSNHKVFVSNW